MKPRSRAESTGVRRVAVVAKRVERCILDCLSGERFLLVVWVDVHNGG